VNQLYTEKNTLRKDEKLQLVLHFVKPVSFISFLPFHIRLQPDFGSKFVFLSLCNGFQRKEVTVCEFSDVDGIERRVDGF
jgi:hypothetical protein